VKVLLISPNFHPKLGGIESHLIELIQSLKDIKFAVLTTWRRGIDQVASALPDVDFHFVWPSDRPLRKWFARSQVSLRPYRLLVATVEMLRSINRRAWLRRIDADIFHFQFLELDQLDRVASRFGLGKLIPMWYRWAVGPAKDGTATLLTDHTVFTASREIVPEETKGALLEVFRNIVSVDAKSFEVVQAFQRRHQGRSWFIPNSVDTKLFTDNRKPHEGFRVGFAGRVGKLGRDLLESVAAQLGSEVQWYFAVAGEDFDVNRTRLLSAAPKAKLYPNLSYARMPEFYSSLDLLVNPFPGEGIGRTTLEAMSCGVPVVCVGTGDKYPIRNEYTGYLLPPDPSLIAKEILNLKRNPELLTLMGRRAREAIASEFSNAVVFPKLRSVYAAIARVA